MRQHTVLLILILPLAVSAQTVHKCRNADGTSSYQQEPCGNHQSEQAAPRIQRGPTLTPQERARIFGEAQPGVVADESGSRVEGSEHYGNPDATPFDSAYERGRIVALQCTDARGRVYFARDRCGRSTIQDGYEADSRVWDAIERGTGRTLKVGLGSPMSFVDERGVRWNPGDVEWRQRSVMRERRVTGNDHGIVINQNHACEGARRVAAQVRADSGRYRERERADRAVTDLCQQGRSLQELPAAPSRIRPR